MKRLIPIVALLLLALSANAQNCESIVLPRFGYDTAAFQNYPEGKILYWCWYSQSAFYESDTVPTGADVFNISEVREAYGDNYLPQSYVVDLTTLSYYAYNFLAFQQRYPRGNVTVCFATPSSTHPYLVLRSIEETFRLTSEREAAYYRDSE
ncbi:MAG: hypothetical protein IJ524_04490 [Bacteroidales bacterium]|nr:hypothetical protein [Bacteroidales bacterium]